MDEETPGNPPVENDTTSVEDPLQVLQNAIAQVSGTGLAANFAVIVEWLEEDGSTALSVMHSPMPAWHLYGLLTYARESECVQLVPVAQFIDCDDDEDWDDF